MGCGAHVVFLIPLEYELGLFYFLGGLPAGMLDGEGCREYVIRYGFGLRVEESLSVCVSGSSRF